MEIKDLKNCFPVGLALKLSHMFFTDSHSLFEIDEVILGVNVSVCVCQETSSIIFECPGLTLQGFPISI